MRLRHDTRTGRLALGVAGWILRRIIGLLARTWRTSVVHGAEHLEALRARPEPVILTFWHNRAVMAAPFLKSRLHDSGQTVAVLASASRDGELATRTLQGWGVHVVRGSATRGGREALWGTYRAIRKMGASPVVIPDGPRGPAYVYKAGVLHLARLSRASLLPLAFACDRFWTVGSWDRLMVPHPFARVFVGIAPPQPVPRELDDADLEAARLLQERLLVDLSRAVELAAATPGSLPLPPATESRRGGEPPP